MNEMTGQDTRDVVERFAYVHSFAVDGELADVFFVRRTAHLQHRHAAAHLAVHLHIAEQDNGVRDGRDVRFRDRCTAQKI